MSHRDYTSFHPPPTAQARPRRDGSRSSHAGVCCGVPGRGRAAYAGRGFPRREQQASAHRAGGSAQHHPGVSAACQRVATHGGAGACIVSLPRCPSATRLSSLTIILAARVIVQRDEDGIIAEHREGRRGEIGHEKASRRHASVQAMGSTIVRRDAAPPLVCIRDTG